MSPQFGTWNFDGLPATPQDCQRLQASLRPFGPDREGCYSGHGVSIVHCAFHTTREARGEIQPHTSTKGAVVALDGCLDNRTELIRLLGGTGSSDESDVAIVARAWDRWGEECFTNLLGDWSVSIWDATERSLCLATDFVGTHPLYYSGDFRSIRWSSLLDPLVLTSEIPFRLNEEYVAGWFSYYPRMHLTPYVGLHSVPAARYVLFQRARTTIREYWKLGAKTRLSYQRDSEYEEHFRAVFRESVRRRLRSDSPILAELSGGMDSASVVSMADTLLAEGGVETPRLDTVSYYDDSEPAWDERPYFTKVEEKRGRIGCHIDLRGKTIVPSVFGETRFASTPAVPAGPTEIGQRISACLASQGNRVLLSGIGGDETLGGVVAPLPELADLLATFQFKRLFQQATAWALARRRPLLHLAAQISAAFLPLGHFAEETPRTPPSWLEPRFVKRHSAALFGYPSRLKLFGCLPSVQINRTTLEGLRRQLSSRTPMSPPCQKRYPYLDRDLWEFLSAVPREQLLRPYQNRSLMRRALANIVPPEILNRRRKAFVVRGPLLAISTEWLRLTELTRNMVTASLGIVNPKVFSAALQEAREGRGRSAIHIMRTLLIEYWLRHLKERNCLQVSAPDRARG